MEVNTELHTPATLTLGNETPVTTEQKTGWTLQPVRMLWKQRNISLPCKQLKHNSSEVQPVALTISQLYYPGCYHIVHVQI